MPLAKSRKPFYSACAAAGIFAISALGAGSLASASAGHESASNRGDMNQIPSSVPRGLTYTTWSASAQYAKGAVVRFNGGAQAGARGELYRQEGWTHFDADAPSRPEAGAQGPGAH